MIVKLLTAHHLEFLSLKGGCRGSSESTLVKMPHCWKSYALAHFRKSYLEPKATHQALSRSSLFSATSIIYPIILPFIKGVLLQLETKGKKNKILR